MSKAQLQARYTHRGPSRGIIAPDHPPITLGNVASALVDTVLHPGRGIIGTTSVGGKGGHVPGAVAQPGLVGSPARSIPALALKNITIATAQHPGQVAGNTAKGFGEIIAGTPAGIAGLVMHPSTIGQLPSAIGKDFSRRYGPLVSGNEKAFRQRVTKEGVAPELLDATVVGGPVLSAGGKLLGTAARAGHLGPALKDIATVRPALRISGGLAKEQQAAPNLFRAVSQRGEDVLRTKALDRRNRLGTRGVQPRPYEGPATRAGVKAAGLGEVVPLFQARAQRVAVSKRAARSYLANKREQTIQLSRGTERDIAGLSPVQREAVMSAASGYLPLRPFQGEAQTAYFGRVKTAIEARRAQIQAHLDANPSVTPPVHPQSELHTLARLEQNIPQAFGDGRLAAFHTANLPRSQRLAQLDPGVKNLDSLRHPYRVQGEAIGVPYEPPVPALAKRNLTKAQELRTAATQAERGVNTPVNSAYNPSPEGINQQTWYHGTGKGGLTKAHLDSTGTRADNLFGQGVYLTNDPAIAKGYATARGRRSGQEHVYAASTNIKNPLDLEASAHPKFAQILANRAKNLAGIGDDALAAHILELAKKPGTTNDNLYAAFRHGVGDFSHQEEIPASELVHDFQTLTGELRKGGWDALTHVGGKRTGKNPHQVVIALDPMDANGLGAHEPVSRFEPHTPGPSASPEQIAATRQAVEHAATRLEKRAAKAVPTRQELQAHDTAYINRVRAEAAKRGLPEPMYFRHQEFPTSGFGARTAANLRRAVAAPKHSELKLFQRGAAITSPDVLVQGLAGNIKRRHQWNAVADTVNAHALPWSRKPNGQGRSVLALKREIQNRGLNPDDFEFIDFRRFRDFTRHVDQGLDTAGDTRGRLEGAVLKPSSITGSKAQLKGMQGFVAVPKGVGEELNAALRPMAKGLRRWGKLQGIQSAAILGLNPSWLQMQVAANSLLYGLGTKGNFKDLAAAQVAVRNLPEDIQRTIAEHIGVGVGMGHSSQPHLGSQGGSLVQKGRAVGQIPLVRTKHGTVRVTDLNPTTPLFAIDEAQNAAFRRAVLYNKAKQQAFQNMKKEIGAAATQTEKVAQLLKLKPGEKLDAQLRRVLANPQEIERLGDHVNNLLGDYLRYTAKERNMLKPFGMFYGFMRYATKTLFYTLPVKHPIGAAVVAKFGQLHNEELRRLFGTRDVPPWVLSRLYGVDSSGNLKRDSKGQPVFKDFARINPVTNPIVDATQHGPKALGQVVSPLVQAVVDQGYARSLFTGRGWQVHGQGAENPNPDYPTRARIFGNQILSSAYPYRELSALTQPGTQGADTFLGSPRPLAYKTAGPQAQEAQRRIMAPSTGERLKQDLLPLVFPKRDASTETQIGKRGGAPTARPANTAAERERQLLIREAQQSARQVVPSARERRLLIREALAARG